MKGWGILVSCIGYEAGEAKRCLVRSDSADFLTEGARFSVEDTQTGNETLAGRFSFWGGRWGAFWWIADFTALDRAGRYRVKIPSDSTDRGESLFSDAFCIGPNILWSTTIRSVALDQLEERSRRARNGIGWKDCGTSWREANSHATTCIGLCDLISYGFPFLEQGDAERAYAQLYVGCSYLAVLQDKAEAIGHPRGALVHEIPNHLLVIPGDVAQAATAFAYASRLCADVDPKRSAEYLTRADAAFAYLMNSARPYGEAGFQRSNHGAAADYSVPDEWMTRDLLMRLWACTELYAAGRTALKDTAIMLAEEILGRQVPEVEAEDGLYGHFYLFGSKGPTEKANFHHHPGHDCGAVFPHYLFPLMDMARRWYDHPAAPRWRETVRRFAYGYFLPACRRNPFYLLPMGIFPGSGLLDFCGPWHGANVTLAFASALATDLEGFLGDQAFRDIAVGNLQWIAGLNAGVSADCFGGMCLWRPDLPTGRFFPYSQIHGIGTRSVGVWTDIPGTIPNGFSANPQFEFSVEPSVEADGPFFFTDEDWIPHSAAWMSALAKLMDRRFLKP